MGDQKYDLHLALRKGRDIRNHARIMQSLAMRHKDAAVAAQDHERAAVHAAEHDAATERFGHGMAIMDAAFEHAKMGEQGVRAITLPDHLAAHMTPNEHAKGTS